MKSWGERHKNTKAFVLVQSAMLRASRGCFSSVLSKDFAHCRLVTLNREKALNALNTEMVEDLTKLYLTNPHPSKDALYVLKGAGKKAFCAGGDVVSIVKDSPPGTSQAFFYKEYIVNHHILTMTNPHVALWDGIVMGGGVGVSIHGKFRVATESALFAMPETGIGLFPDVGGSWFLPRMADRSIGLYLALTGRRLKGADLLHTGLATHYVPSGVLPSLEEQLCSIKDPRMVEDVLSAFAVKKDALPPFGLEKDQKLIDEVFQPSRTVEEMIALLQSNGSDTAAALATGMRKCCPSAMKVSLELFRRGAALTDPAKVFEMEYYATQKAVQHGDFTAGVTALLIEKTNAPQWNPASLEEVSNDLVQSFFTPVTPSTVKWCPNVAFEKAQPAAKL